MDVRQNAIIIDVHSLPEVTVQGNIDFTSVEKLRTALENAIEKKPAELIVDLSDVCFNDSTGVEALIDCRKSADSIGCRLVIKAASKQALRALQFSGLAGLLDLPVLRVDSSTTPPDRSVLRTLDWEIYEYTTLAEPELIVTLREIAVDAAAQSGMDDEKTGDVRLAVGEALLNALRHACPKGCESVIRLKCLVCACGMVIEISDEGEQFDYENAVDAGPQECGQAGIGIKLITGAMNEVEYSHTGKGNRLRMIKWI